ncbi:hypothetical protein OSTOST_09998 [Ostertagia ostertagi]
MTERQLECAGYTVSDGWAVPLALQMYWKPVIIMIYEAKVVTETDLMPPSDWSRILHKMVAAPGYFDVALIESVMAKVPNLSNKRRRQVRRIMNISLSESLCAVDFDEYRGTVSTTAEPPADGFVLCDSEEWCSVPLGLLPGASVDTFSLILDNDWISAQTLRNDRELSVIEEDD